MIKTAPWRHPAVMASPQSARLWANLPDVHAKWLENNKPTSYMLDKLLPNNFGSSSSLVNYFTSEKFPELLRLYANDLSRGFFDKYQPSSNPLMKLSLDSITAEQAGDKLAFNATGRSAVIVYKMGRRAFVSGTQSVFNYAGGLKLDGWRHAPQWVQNHLPVDDVEIVNCDDVLEEQYRQIAKLINDDFKVHNIRWTKGSSKAIAVGSEASYEIDKYLPPERRFNGVGHEVKDEINWDDSGQVTISEDEYSRLLKLEKFVKSNREVIQAMRVPAFDATKLRKLRNKRKLKDEEIQLAKELVAKSYTYRSVAESFGVSEYSIRSLLDTKPM